MSESVLTSHGLCDESLDRRLHDMPITGMHGSVIVGTSADVGIRDDLIYLDILKRSGRNDTMLTTALRDMILAKKITFADIDYEQDLPPPTFAAKISDILGDKFIKHKIQAYQLNRPYKYSLLVLSCVAGKLSKRLVALANDAIIKTGGHQLVYAKSRYTDADFNRTEIQIMTNLKYIFDNIFAAIGKLDVKQIPRIVLTPIAFPPYTITPVKDTPKTPMDSACAIEKFLLDNRAVFNQVEQYYIARAKQINAVIQLVMTIYTVYFGKEAAQKAYGDCID
jgi:hypothetical protein